MSRNRDEKIVFIRLMNFNDESNKAINKAIMYSGDYMCEDVNTIHLFLALLNNTKIGQSILKHIDKTYDDIFECYKNLVDAGEFGKLDTSDIPFSIEYFSPEMFSFVAMCAQKAFMRQSEVTPDMLMDELLSFESECLEVFLAVIGVSIDDINKAVTSFFYIPDDIAEFVEDIHSLEVVTSEKIENVDNYVDDMIEILSRKKKANPCIIGEAGVGKTTIVYRLAQRINKGKVPDFLKETHIVYVNGATLTSGTRFRGEFEERMKTIMNWASKVNVIMFLDEIHTFINSGNTGHNDGATAGNMIKKYLADGSIKIIGTTTLKEYHSFIENDKAFNRRLQKIVIGEPSIKDAINMLKKSVSDYEEYHNVLVPYNVIEMCVELSDRYIKDNFLPDKAYTILDQACAKSKLNSAKEVSEDLVLDVVSKLTGIDINKLGDKATKDLLNLENNISKKLIGQEQAVKTVCKAIRRAKAGVSDKDKPLASFLFVGPTGVGKTELCKVLSEQIGLSKQSFIKIDMSEFSEKNSVSRLLGTTAGYIGYGDGGQLTEKVKHNPYSVVLLDEIEKAHPDIYNTFLQLLDEGKLTDGEGTTVDFTNCIIVMTSNAGYGADGNKASLGFGNSTNEISAKEAERKALKALENTFKPEFLNRIDNIVIFEKLTKEQCNSIVKLMLNKIINRLKEQNISITFNKSVIDMIVHNGYSDRYGARNLKREIQDTIEDFLADEILKGNLKSGDNKSISFTNETLVLKERQ